MNWFRKNFRSCEEENAESGARASTSRGRGKGSNSLDHEIVQLTKLRSGPNEHLSKMVHGKHNVPISTVKMLAAREGNYSGRGRFSSADSCHVLSRYLPVNGPYMVDQMDSRAYVSQFSVDGSLLVAAYQGSHIRIYDVENGWKVRKDILAKSLRWTITDTCLSPDQRYLVYSSLSPIVHIVNVGSAVTQSLANVTEIHDGLDFSGEGGNDDNLFEIFSVKFSTDGRELVAASSVDSLYVYDLATNRLALKILAHEDDVNTVCFADESGHLIYSGSDDSFCKIWDRRCLNWKDKPAGTLIGHLEGITFIDSRGDGRYLISNGKDQTTKLWDIRKMSSNPSCVPRRNYNWDYRQMDYPAKLKDKKHPNDQSLATYKGHSVLQTLIRCYFSPAYSTGQKYIYTGSNDASVYIYDLVSGALVAKLGHHESTVRDCSWHPHYPMMISSSWDGSIIRCEFPGGDATPSPLPRRRSQRRHFF
ncbi:hypothetical protein Nepgr_010190 [Nepenthes gracilis]|uniref:LEC14B homolog n=1 Tax=Nepenthes gracilis TaxID=150966 RepID=A0AAD3SCK9_NEPGR|nr:hypothetical protein Nepgr_010190 [Nepenthes gracilis]